jgi:hypothetical protein
MTDDLDRVRRGLAARHDVCVERLSDAASELYTLHGASPEEIIDHVWAAIDEERRAAETARAQDR